MIFIERAPVSGGNSFSIIQPDNGTSPTATSGADTLTITSSDESVYVDGDASTDTIDLTTSLKISSKTTTYTVLSSDKLVIGDTSSAGFTLTLPAPATVANKVFVLQKITGATDFNALTIDPTGAATIGGKSSIKLFGAGETVYVVSDGSEYLIIDWVNSEYMTYTPTISGATNVDVNTARVFFGRDGIHIHGQATFTGSGGAASQVTVALPSGPVIDTAEIPGGTGTGNATASLMTYESVWFDSGTAWKEIKGYYSSTTTVGFRESPGLFLLSSIANGDAINYIIKAPVA